MAIEIDKFILCDDIREEKNGKNIIVGMYHDDTIIINSQLPYIHPMLGILITGKIDHYINEMSVRICDSDNKTLINSPIEIHKPKNKKNNKFKIILNIGGFPIIKQGIYQIVVCSDTDEITLPFTVIHHHENI